MRLRSKALAACLAGALVAGSASGGEAGPAVTIHVNQLGFLPTAHKLAVVPTSEATAFSIVKAGTGNVVFSGNLSAAATWEPAGESVQLADFSAIQQPGNYQVRVKGLPDSTRFAINANEYAQLNQPALRYYYLNRASTAVGGQFADKYARAAGHPDDHVLVHASAATASRPEGTVISSPGGWYDAGDYDKYIVNSGISTYTLLAAYEHFPDYYSKQGSNIPESHDQVPDVLNEAMWNLQWMLSMQDEDGGVYHKLTNKLFDGMVIGGPNPLQIDAKDCKVAYPSKVSAKSYLDDVCSYTTSEVAINWNAPLVYVSGALQSLTR